MSYYVAVPCHDANPQFLAWLDSLSLEQRRELGALDRQWSIENPDNDGHEIMREITKDWIEEHGGRRGWWGVVSHEQEGTS